MFNTTLCNFGSDDQIFLNNTLSKISKFVYSTIEGVYFYDCEFNELTLFNSIFSLCTFKNAEFNITMINYGIFNECKFINCPNINFDYLKEEGIKFIDCTNDGEEI